ncbi:rhomboid family intramembrane serine protease [Ectothiorhodospiraceae bacterium 2226]|nr:rhomboid family intramembrane serine protease [Ectothiorhodospiraceae bacterium 2226]
MPRTLWMKRLAETRVGRALRRTPVVVWVLLVPSWVTALIMDRDEFATDHLLYYHIPDLTEAPLRILPNLFVTPLVNTQVDQVILITILIGTFGVLVERRLGALAALAIFWGTSAAAALGAGVLLHLLYPLFPDVHTFGEGGWYRVFNGASAGGFGLMAAYAALSPRPWLWIGLFALWEPTFWLLVTNDYTFAFHFIAFTTGFVGVRLYQRRQRRSAPAGST